MSTLKTTVLLAAMTGLLMFVGQLFGGSNGMMIMLVISLGMNFFSYWYSDKIVLRMYNAQEVTAQESPDFVRMVANLAKRSQLPMPKVYIIQSDVPNAFATGRDPEHAAVAATTGIMRVLTYEELEGVMAHELSHVKHRDTLISTVVASLAGVITMIAHVAQWAAIFGSNRSDEDDRGGIIGLLFTIILAPLAASLIQLAISRSREYAADESGGKMCGNPLALASALEKIDAYAHNRLMPQATESTSHLFIINPFSGARSWMSNMFSTHPATADRVNRLRQQAGKYH